MKLDKMPYIIYDGVESLIKKTDGCTNNPEKSLTTKIAARVPWGYSMSTMSIMNNIKNRDTKNSIKKVP